VPVVLVSACASTTPEPQKTARSDCATTADPAKCRSEQKLAELTAKYSVLIVQKIQNNWRTPTGNYPSGLEIVVAVVLDPKGNVTDVKVVSSTGYPKVDRTAVVAMMEASPLPIPAQAEHYPHFRNMEIQFLVPDH